MKPKGEEAADLDGAIALLKGLGIRGFKNLSSEQKVGHKQTNFDTRAEFWALLAQIEHGDPEDSTGGPRPHKHQAAQNRCRRRQQLRASTVKHA